MNCRILQMGRIVAFSKWDELTLGTNCRFLVFGTNCRLGRIVAWDESSLGTNCRPTAGNRNPSKELRKESYVLIDQNCFFFPNKHAKFPIENQLRRN